VCDQRVMTCAIQGFSPLWLLVISPLPAKHTDQDDDQHYQQSSQHHPRDHPKCDVIQDILWGSCRWRWSLLLCADPKGKIVEFTGGSNGCCDTLLQLGVECDVCYLRRSGGCGEHTIVVPGPI